MRKADYWERPSRSFNSGSSYDFDARRRRHEELSRQDDYEFDRMMQESRQRHEKWKADIEATANRNRYSRPSYTPSRDDDGPGLGVGVILIVFIIIGMFSS